VKRLTPIFFLLTPLKPLKSRLKRWHVHALIVVGLGARDGDDTINSHSWVALPIIFGIVQNSNSRDVLSLPNVVIMASATKSLMGLCLPEVGKYIGSHVGKGTIIVSRP
jgi:hypothetical protein